MARRQSIKRGDVTSKRKRNRLLEGGLQALGVGLFVLLAPAMISNSTLHLALAGLRTLGWFAAVLGLALIGLHWLEKKLEHHRAAKLSGASHPKSTFRQPAAANAHAVSNEPSFEAALVNDLTSTDSPSAVAYVENVGIPKAVAVPSTWSKEVFAIIEWRRFEALCELLFAQAGFETKAQSHGADGGIDIWLYSKNFPDGPVSVVQCKHWTTKTVKVNDVRALLGSMTDKKVKRGIFATTSTFTHDAKQFASDNGIQLLDCSGLLDLIATRSPEQQQALLAEATRGEFWIPTCASCGIKLVRRVRKAGGGFWGCANYPRCRTIING